MKLKEKLDRFFNKEKYEYFKRYDALYERYKKAKESKDYNHLKFLTKIHTDDYPTHDWYKLHPEVPYNMFGITSN